jgi:hypothetical protein
MTAHSQISYPGTKPAKAGSLVAAIEMRGYYTAVQTPVEKHSRHSDNLVLRLLAISVKSLRYWSTGFEDDDAVANTWREFLGKEVDDLLSVLAARGL